MPSLTTLPEDPCYDDEDDGDEHAASAKVNGTATKSRENNKRESMARSLGPAAICACYWISRSGETPKPQTG